MLSQSKDHGKAGPVGRPVPTLAEWEPEFDQGSTTPGYPALGVQHIQRTVKVKFFFSLQLHYSVVKVMCYFLVEGAWMSWGPWGTCSTSCGQGTKSRSRGHSAGLPCTGSDTNVGNCQSEVNYFLPRSNLFNQSI